MMDKTERTIIIREGNPLYFPSGNEKGEFYERLFIATDGINRAHGRTPEEALNNLAIRVSSITGAL